MRENKTRLTAHHFMSASSDSQSHSFSSSCFFFSKGTPSKCIPPSSPNLSFSPLPGPWQIVQFGQSINLSLPSGLVLRRVIYGQHAHATSYIPESNTLNGMNIWRWKERQKNVGQINLPFVCHTLILCHRLTSAKSSKWNSTAGLEYKECNTSVWLEQRGWEYILID